MYASTSTMRPTRRASPSAGSRTSRAPRMARAASRLSPASAARGNDPAAGRSALVSLVTDGGRASRRGSRQAVEGHDGVGDEEREDPEERGDDGLVENE